MSPFEALYGIIPPIHISYIPNDPHVAIVDINIRDWEVAINILKQHLTKAACHMKQVADRRRSKRSFKVGDQVYLKL